MTTYCFSLIIDGEEQPTTSVESGSVEAAVAQGRDILMSAAMTVEPNLAYCVVYAGGDIEGEPVGVWDYRADSPNLQWTPAEL